MSRSPQPLRQAGFWRVLVIEPDAGLHPSFELGLRHAGIQSVAFAATGPAGLSTTASFGPDLVLSEVMLPGLDGLSVAARLGLHPGTARIPVIFTTASPALAEAAVRARTGNAIGVLAKPFPVLNMGALLADLLQRAGLQSATQASV